MLIRLLPITLFLILISSCNVASLVTGDETDLGENFANNELKVSLSAFFRFDDGSGDQKDSVSGFFANNVIPVAIGSGRHGTALYCNDGNGSNPPLNYNGGPSFAANASEDATISFWANPDTTLTGNQQTYILSDSSTLDLRWEDLDGEGDSPDLTVNVNANIQTFYDIPVPNNTWTHVVLTLHDGGDYRVVYINGSFHDSSSGNSSISFGNTVWAIGSLPSGTNFFIGQLDSMGWWNRALDSDEVRDLYEGNHNLD